MASTVKLTNESDEDLTLYVTRVDQRITIEPIVVERAGQELPKARPTRSKRKVLFIITGKATQTQKNAIETASETWWDLGSGATQGRIRFTWDTNNGGSAYECVFTKVDFWKESGKQKYEYLIELEEGDFS